MFLSIIIPTYNDELFIRECLDSCLSQDISANDYEIICVDDSSTDGTLDIIRDYSSKNHNLHTILKERHGGGVGGRTLGYQQSKGEYVWFVDHDDMIAPNILSQLKKRIDETQCDRLVFPVYYFSNQLKEAEEQGKNDKTLVPNGAMYRNAIWASILRKQFLLDHDIWPRTKKVPADKPIWFADGFFISECIRAGAREAEYNDCAVYFYRHHSKQETANHSDKMERIKIQGLVNLAACLKMDYEKEVLENGRASEVTANHYMQWVRTASTNIASLPKKMYREGISEMKKAGVFPISRPSECTYLACDCVRNNKRNGMGAVKSVLYYFSTTSWGLPLYRMSFIKMHISRLIRKNAFASRLLDIKNKAEK